MSEIEAVCEAVISATAKDLKKRGRKQAESTSQTKLTKFFKPNKNQG